MVPLALTGTVRMPLLPEVPLMIEQGFDLRLDGWYGILAPAGTPDAIVRRLHAETRRILSDPELRPAFVALNLPPVPRLSPEGFDAVVRDEIPRWRKIIVESDVKVD